MNIKILGTGCSNCKILEANVIQALKDIGKEANVEKVTEIQDIMSYGVMGTPGLVIDEKVIFSGRAMDVKGLKELLSKEEYNDLSDSCCDSEQNQDEGCCSDKDSCSIDCAPQKEPEQPKSKCACGGMC